MPQDQPESSASSASSLGGGGSERPGKPTRIGSGDDDNSCFVRIMNAITRLLKRAGVFPELAELSVETRLSVHRILHILQTFQRDMDFERLSFYGKYFEPLIIQRQPEGQGPSEQKAPILDVEGQVTESRSQIYARLGMAGKNDLELQYGVNYVDLSELKTLAPNCLHLLPQTLVQQNRAAVIKRDGNAVTVAMVNPNDLIALEEVKTHLKKWGLQIRRLNVCTEGDFEAFMTVFNDLLPKRSNLPRHSCFIRIMNAITRNSKQTGILPNIDELSAETQLSALTILDILQQFEYELDYERLGFYGKHFKPLATQPQSQEKASLESQFGVVHVDLAELSSIPQDCLYILPQSFVHQNQVVAIKKDGCRVSIAMVNPSDLETLDKVNMHLKKLGLQTSRLNVCSANDFMAFVAIFDERLFADAIQNDVNPSLDEVEVSRVKEELEGHYGKDYLCLKTLPSFNCKCLLLLPATIIKRYQMVVVANDDNLLTVAMTDPNHLDALEVLKERLKGRRIKVTVCSADDFKWFLQTILPKLSTRHMWAASTIASSK